MSLEQTFLAELLDAIKNDRLTLPTLPEVALRIREAVEDPEATSSAIANEIAKDAALAARVIKVANSPLLRGRIAVDNLQLAITRMGIAFVRNLATGLAMEQMFQATNDQVDARLRETWEHSIEVASICQVLASHYTDLKPDQAMLAGLVHEIGTLPILTCAEDTPDILEHKGILEKVIHRLHPKIGAAILKTWDFPPELVAIPMGYLDFERTHEGPADYVDLVTVANLQSYAGSNHRLSQVDWNTVPAFKKLGMSPEVDVHDVDELAEDLSVARSALS
ncbi:HDOD domain-containing protein [Pleionea mediterranea]|jgi:HD-like signal output (HDOD) protein|uniref:HD-like signal output (HDOD) protein n=1 Tax=Pleionea mediterranea TaxID=523701 RepID=A0A316G1B0_9GAMM|nr:HDOD domain-containing protein [Pleionea mediterranea]PWK54462.1 HD-like signal output (HDOD) protein [Pleionea mediterranea]